MSMITEQVEKLRELSKQDKLGLIPWNGCSEILNQAADTIEQLAAKVRPITGQWKRISFDAYSEHSHYWYKCSNCDGKHLGNTNYCPNCGAKMEGSDADSD